MDKRKRTKRQWHRKRKIAQHKHEPLQIKQCEERRYEHRFYQELAQNIYMKSSTWRQINGDNVHEPHLKSVLWMGRKQLLLHLWHLRIAIVHNLMIRSWNGKQSGIVSMESGTYPCTSATQIIFYNRYPIINYLEPFVQYIHI